MTWSPDGSEPLAQTLYALRGSMSHKVLSELKFQFDVLSRNNPLPKRLQVGLKVVDTLEECGEGLILVDGAVRGNKRSYSTRYTVDKDKGHYVMTIGSELDQEKRRFQQAVTEIIAMLKRGVSTWTTTEYVRDVISRTRTCRSAYGMVAVEKQPPADPNAWKAQRDLERRALSFMHRGYGW
jgi:hypothetical protein